MAPKKDAKSGGSGAAKGKGGAKGGADSSDKGKTKFNQNITI